MSQRSAKKPAGKLKLPTGGEGPASQRSHRKDGGQSSKRGKSSSQRSNRSKEKGKATQAVLEKKKKAKAASNAMASSELATLTEEGDEEGHPPTADPLHCNGDARRGNHRRRTLGVGRDRSADAAGQVNVSIQLPVSRRRS